MSSGKWKTVITIWSAFDPTETELSKLAFEAEEGAAICTGQDVTFVADPSTDPNFGQTGEFFVSSTEEES
jgi:hypothetical protein